MDGTISPDSQYYILYEYFDSIPCGETRVLAVIRSDAQKLDSDGDESNDAVDAYPTRVNPLINYIVVGVDYPGKTTLKWCADRYEAAFEHYNMEYIRINIYDTCDFLTLWYGLKNMVVEGGNYVRSDHEYYRGVDNLVIICHGYRSYTVVNPNLPATDDNILMSSNYYNLSINQNTHINAIDLYSCYSGYIDNNTYAPAAILASYCQQVDYVYGYDGEARYASFVGYRSVHFYPECLGYYRFWGVSDDFEAPFSSLFDYDVVAPTYVRHVRNGSYLLYYDFPHSFESSGD